MKRRLIFKSIGMIAGIILASAPGIHGQITYHPINGDADSEIDSTKVYTHAIDFGNDGGKALINGVQFQSGGTSSFGSIVGTSATVGTGSTTIPSGHNGNDAADPYLDGGTTAAIENLVDDMQYNDATGEIILTGLAPGQPYRFRLYNRGWSTGAANRSQNIGFDTDGVGTSIAEAEDTGSFNPDNATNPDPSFANWWQVNALTYEYVLPPGVTRLKVYINQTGGGTYHLYGLTNEEAGPDETSPVVETLSPSDDETPAVGDAVYPGANLVATFDEGIALTGSGTITITDDDDASSTVTIDLSSLPDTDGAVSVSETVLTIDPAINLEFGTNYSVQISANAIEDLADMPNAFAGIADSTTWNFITAAVDGTAPVLAPVDPFSPADEASSVQLDSPLTVTFDEDILVNSGAGSVLLSEDFETGDGLFNPANKATGTDWAHGDPESPDEGGGEITSGNNGSAQCWGTNLTGSYATDTDACLRSPVINLSGIASASLSFAMAIDAEAGSTLEVNVIDDTTDAVITNLIPAAGDGDIGTASWEMVGPVALPSAALGQPVRIEWRFTGSPSTAYLGAYIDDVTVTGLGTTDVITLKDLTNVTDTIIPINDSSQVSVSGATLTITPSSVLAPMADYAVQIGSTAIRNYNDLDFAGIAGTTTWNFETTGPVLLTWDPSGGGTSDGAGTWLGAGEWWDGSANVDWANSTPDNAIIGNGGGGGSITMGAANAGTVLLDNFTGTYTFSGGSLDQSGGITVGANAGNVTINSAVTGAGGITINGPSRVNLRGAAKPFTGDLIVGGGGEALDDDFIGIGNGNLNLNGGAYVNYWSDTFTRTLGTGAGQVQLPGGESGFCGQGRAGLSIRLNNDDNFVVQWGDPLFNPSTLLLQTPWANTNGKLTFRNKLDLNGAPRTIKVNKDHLGATDGYAQISNEISNSDAGNPASLTKTGPGRLILSAANTYDGGTTMTEGFLVINGSLADASMTISGGTVEGSGTLTFNGTGATLDQITMTGGTLSATGLTVNINGTLTQSEYVLVDATGGGSISGSFAALTGAPDYTLDYGTANQVKLVGPGSSDPPYGIWTGGPFAGILADPDASLDFDGGGLPTGIEWLVGGDPTDPGDDAGLAPGIDTTTSPGNALFVFRQTAAAGADTNTTIMVEYGSNLQGWTEAEHDVAGVSIVVEENGFGPGVDKVTVTLPDSLAVGNELYARLNVVVAAP